MEWKDEKLKNIIGKYFNYSFNFDFLEIVKNIIERMDAEYTKTNLTEELNIAIDDELIYTDDLWTIAKYYASSPKDIVWDDVYEEFYNDCYEVASQYFLD